MLVDSDASSFIQHAPGIRQSSNCDVAYCRRAGALAHSTLPHRVFFYLRARARRIAMIIASSRTRGPACAHEHVRAAETSEKLLRTPDATRLGRERAREISKKTRAYTYKLTPAAPYTIRTCNLSPLMKRVYASARVICVCCCCAVVLR